MALLLILEDKNTSVNGKMTKGMDMASNLMRRDGITSVNLKITYDTAMAPSLISAEQNMSVNGKMVRGMDMEL